MVCLLWLRHSKGTDPQDQVDIKSEISGKSGQPESKGVQFRAEQLTQMMHVLQQMKSTYSGQGTSDSAASIYAGPFVQEATGAWLGVPSALNSASQPQPFSSCKYHSSYCLS